MTAARVFHPLSPRRRGRPVKALLLASTAFLLACGLLVQVSPASAGEWMQRSCSYEGEYIAPEGWEAKGYYGYEPPSQAYCERVAEGGGLTAYATPISGDEPFAGQGWAYKPPHGSTILGGKVDARLKTRNGFSAVEAVVAERPVGQFCEYPSCEGYEGTVSIPAEASEVFVRAGCLGVYEDDVMGVCHMPGTQWKEGDGVFSAEAAISSAEFIFATKAAPKGSGFSGTLLDETVSGAGTLSFTAAEAGPGVYQVRLKVDGNKVWAETPNTDEEKCAPAGESGGVRIFDSPQPCPTETAVHVEVHTAILADGAHTVAVEVEDAAGDVSTVYSGTIITANHAAPTTVPTTAPTTVGPATAQPERGPCNGAPCDESAKLITSAGEAKTLNRALSNSTVALTGRLIGPTGAPVKGAQVKLLEQIVGSAAATPIASATTSPDGSWALDAPAGPSRLLQVAFYSHTLDTAPASILDFHESVRGVVSMHAPRHVRLGRAVIFIGQLAGGYVPARGESVQMEIFYSGRWRTIEVIPTSSKGRWMYKYVFTLGAGTSYLFRAVTVPNGGYPFLSADSKPVRITVSR
jgi:hypothetical protein